MKSQVSGATRRAAGPFRGETWLALDEAREKVWEIDEAPDETPGKVFGRRKGKDFGGEEENIEHRTFNIERRSLDGRKGRFGTKFETKLG